MKRESLLLSVRTKWTTYNPCGLVTTDLLLQLNQAHGITQPAGWNQSWKTAYRRSRFGIPHAAPHRSRIKRVVRDWFPKLKFFESSSFFIKNINKLSVVKLLTTSIAKNESWLVNFLVSNTTKQNFSIFWRLFFIHNIKKVNRFDAARSGTASPHTAPPAPASKKLRGIATLIYSPKSVRLF